MAFEDIDAATRAQALERLQKVAPRVGTVELDGPSTTSARGGGETHALPARLRLSPGVHAFEIASGAATLRWSVELRAGTTVRKEVILRDGTLRLRTPGQAPDETSGPRAAAADTRPPTNVGSEGAGERDLMHQGTGAGIPLVSVIGYGLAAAATGAAAYFGVSTLDARDRWRGTAAGDARPAFYRDRARTNVEPGRRAGRSRRQHGGVDDAEQLQVSRRAVR